MLHHGDVHHLAVESWQAGAEVRPTLGATRHKVSVHGADVPEILDAVKQGVDETPGVNPMVALDLYPQGLHKLSL